MAAINRVSQFVQGVKTSINRHSLKMSEYICENFKHPRNNRIPWNFNDHEYQIAIVDEKHPDRVVKKCAQVGLSELSIRKALSFCAMMDYRKLAYVLPTAKFSSEFSSTRFDPAIESSEYISSVLSKDVDNTGAKKIGTCFLLMRGTSGTTAAISIDLDCIITDEIDFCNQDVLGSFASRLQHSDLKITEDFSTPTVPDYGVSALFADSTQGHYMVRHSKCEELVAPRFFSDVIIPAFDEGITAFRKDDLSSIGDGILDAYIKCPNCGVAIGADDFSAASRREWVHKYSLGSGISKVGFQVKPWDVPKYNPLVDVLTSIKRYKLYSDWVNFRCGVDYADAENSFLEFSAHGRGTSLEALETGGTGFQRVFIGADLGKTSWIVIGVPDGGGKLRIICAESVLINDLEGVNLGTYLVILCRKLLCCRSIVDAAPNYETAMYMHSQLLEGQAYGAYYGSSKQNTLDIYAFNNANGVVTIERTNSFDATAKAYNAGMIVVNESEGTVGKRRSLKGGSVQRPPFFQHLHNMKKVRVLSGGGVIGSSSDLSRWVSTGPDHFAHALNYCYTAFASVEERFRGQGRVGGVSVGSVKLKDGKAKEVMPQI